jgi:deoxyribodipyrimidine photolyase-related protein
MKTALILLPNQLFKLHNIDFDFDKIFIWTHPKFFTDLKFHKNKLVFHYATIMAYQDKMKKKYTTEIIEDINIREIRNLEKIIIYDPTDFEIKLQIQKYCKKNKIELEILESPLFLLTTTDLEEYIKSTKKPYFNHTFYVWIRNRTGILMHNNKPVGNSYSFDTENRLPFKQNYKEDKIKIYSNKYIKNAIQIVEKKYKNNVGEITPFIPVTHEEAMKHFKQFLKKKLDNFGPYEDSFRDDVKIGFHSNISALLNIGLLNINEIIKLTLEYYKDNKIKIQSVEGFLRQIISWREYVRMLYLYEHEKFNKMNFFKHQRKINNNWYNGTTMIKPVDDVIKKINSLSYAHHIERLMILSNFALLTQIKPKEIYNWFLSFVSIDAYEWVMEPNVYGMGIHSVGQLMMNRPYFSSSNYLFKMNPKLKKQQTDKIKIDNEEYSWNEIWDCLYYNFINKNKDYLKKIYSTASSVGHLKRKTSNEIKKITKVSNIYMKNY